MTDINLSVLMAAYPDGVNWSTVDYDWSTVDDSPLACVSRGMAYLLATYPGRLSTVDVVRLDVADGECCPLAQTSGTGQYWRTIEYATKSDDWQAAHGFRVESPAPGNPTSPERDAALNVLWRTAIRAWQSWGVDA